MAVPLPVDPTNAAQLEAWDGDEGTYWAKHADRFDHALAPHHREFMAASAITSGQRVLDIGCGTGQTTIDAAREAAPGIALGVDLSTAMLEVARRRAADEGVTNATFLQADAQVHAFETAFFDVVAARTVAMFFGDQAAAFANLRRALRDGGRLVMLTWQPLAGNEWIEVVATALSPPGAVQLPPPGAGPFSLSEPDEIRSLLEGAGFAGIELRAIEEPMWFGTDPDDATEFILGLQGWRLRDANADERARAVAALRAACVNAITADGVSFRSAAWLTMASVR